jgi:hypothetical protein
MRFPSLCSGCALARRRNKTSRAKGGQCSVRLLAHPAFALPPTFQAREEERRNTDSNPKQNQCRIFFSGVRRPPSGSGSRKAAYGPLSERGSHRHHARLKHHCVFTAIMFFFKQEIPGHQKTRAMAEKSDLFLVAFRDRKENGGTAAKREKTQG